MAEKTEKTAKDRIRAAMTDLNIFDVKLKWDSKEHPAPPLFNPDGLYLRIHIAEEYVPLFADLLEEMGEAEKMTNKFMSQANFGMAYEDDEVQEKEEKE